MKKISLLALALSTTFGTAVVSQAPAAPCPCPKAFQGFSFGGTIGYGVGRATTSTTTDSRYTYTSLAAGAVPVTNRDKVSSDSNPGIAGADGGLLVGYLQRFGNFGLGVDFLANWASSSGSENRDSSNNGTFGLADTSKTSESSSISVKLKNSLQVRGVFSYVISNLVMPKIMLGWDNSQYQFNMNGLKTESSVTAILPNPETIATKLVPSLTAKKRLNGFLWGAGIDFLVAKNVVCGLEYTGVATASFSPTSTLGGSSFTQSAIGVAGTQPITGTIASKFKAQYNTFKMTVKYIF